MFLLLLLAVISLNIAPRNNFQSLPRFKPRNSCCTTKLLTSFTTKKNRNGPCAFTDFQWLGSVLTGKDQRIISRYEYKKRSLDSYLLRRRYSKSLTISTRVLSADTVVSLFSETRQTGDSDKKTLYCNLEWIYFTLLHPPGFLNYSSSSRSPIPHTWELRIM